MEIASKKKVAEGKVLDLGNLGKVEEVPEATNWPEIPTFPWFGVDIRVNPNLTDAVLFDLVESEGDLDLEKPEEAIKAAKAMKEFVRSVIHPTDFEDFWKLGKAHGYSMEKFAETAGAIVQEVTGNPTQESSDSSATPSDTATRSTGGSSQQLQSELEQEGRPDLAEFFLLARENGVAAGH